MGIRNYLIEGVSGTGKTSVCNELQRQVDLDTLNRRLDERPDSEWGSGKPTERELIARLHQTKEDIPKNGISIDATASVARVVDEIVRQSKADK